MDSAPTDLPEVVAAPRLLLLLWERDGVAYIIPNASESARGEGAARAEGGTRCGVAAYTSASVCVAVSAVVFWARKPPSHEDKPVAAADGDGAGAGADADAGLDGARAAVGAGSAGAAGGCCEDGGDDSGGRGAGRVARDGGGAGGAAGVSDTAPGDIGS
jgi:hypothetical protein